MSVRNKTVYGAIVVMIFLTCADQSKSNDSDAKFEKARHAMVNRQLMSRDIDDDKVISAMRKVPRHLFVPEQFRDDSYRDGPLPIKRGQTISQPYIVALMTQLLEIDSASKILEIGTGSGYQAAVLAEISDSVYTIEIIESLSLRADTLLDSLGYKNVHTRARDGYVGWPEAEPFDAIIVTAAAPKIPQPLIDQLKVGGVMVIPVGEHSQDLKLIRKEADGIVAESIIPVRFVPMTGEVREK